MRNPPRKAVVGEWVTYLDLEGQVSKFVVLGCRWDGTRGEMWYLVAYADGEPGDEVELELSGDEMSDLLNRRVPVDGQ